MVEKSEAGGGRTKALATLLCQALSQVFVSVFVFFFVFVCSDRPFPRGGQRFYKAFGDSEKNFSIDAYIVEGFEV